jgi:hypothetical protein
MRKLITTLAIAGLIGLMPPLAVSAAAVRGYEAQYDALIGGCTLAAGSVDLCGVAINDYSTALLGLVDLSEANESFSEARREVFAANEPDEVFQFAIDALFEELLPDSGAVLGFDALQASPN